MRVLVTGASGFIGGHLCASLVKSGAHVHATTRGTLSRNEAVAWTQVGDLTNREGLRGALQGIDAVVHLAARVHQREPQGHDANTEYRRVNVDGTRVLLEEARAAGVERFVFASTVKVMGDEVLLLLNEDMEPHPNDAYGASKLEAENCVRHFASDRFRTVILRLPLVYGPGVKANMLKLFLLVDRGVPLPFGRVDNRRSLLFVGNLAKAVDSVLDRAPSGSVYFVSDAEDVSTPQLIRAMAEALERPARMLPVPVSLLKAAGRIGDGLARVLPFPLTSEEVKRLAGSLTVDPSRIRQEAGYRPRYSLAEGLARTATWLRESVVRRR